MSEYKERTIKALTEFVERVTKENATAEEMQLLPHIALALLGEFEEKD